VCGHFGSAWSFVIEHMAILTHQQHRVSGGFKNALSSATTLATMASFVNVAFVGLALIAGVHADHSCRPRLLCSTTGSLIMLISSY
jgi:hypothetical protein